MALTGASAAQSSLYIRQKSKNALRSSISPVEIGAKKRVVVINHTVVAADGSGSIIVTLDEMNLVELPAGARIDLKESYVLLSATQGAATNISLGHRAYVGVDGVTVAEDSDSVITDILGSTTTIVNLNTLTKGVKAQAPSGMGVIAFDSKGPVILYQVALNAGGTFDGDVGDIYSYQFTYWVD